MEMINQIMSFADAVVGHLPQQIPPIDSMALAASIIALSVFFTAPIRLAQLFGTAALAVLGLLILFAPGYTMVFFVIGCGLAGVVRHRKRLALLQKQLDKLSRIVQELELVENRRLIQSLNPPSPSVDQMNQQDAPSILPSEHTDGPADSPELHNVKSLYRA